MCEVRQVDAQRIIEATFYVIRAHFASLPVGRRVIIKNFGSFHIRERKWRAYKVPFHGDKVFPGYQLRLIKFFPSYTTKQLMRFHGSNRDALGFSETPSSKTDDV